MSRFTTTSPGCTPAAKKFMFESINSLGETVVLFPLLTKYSVSIVPY